MKKILLMLGLSLLIGPLYAQRVIDVVKQGEGKISINLAAYRTSSDAASKTFLATLKSDLNRSGYFTVASSAAALNVVGTCVSDGTNLKAECQVYQVASRQRVLGKNYRVSVDATRTLAHKVADEIVLAVTGKPGMASGKIVLIGDRTGRKELYICEMDGQGLRQLTNDRSIVVSPRWTPDGKSVIYTSYKRGSANVFMLDRAQPLAGYAGLNAGGAISPDGTRMALALSLEGNPELYVKNLRTGALQRMTYTRLGNEASPTWSPDGSHIAYVSDTTGTPQIYIIPATGGQAQRLTGSGSESVAPEWGRNGVIVYSTRVGGRYRIALADPVRRTSRVLETDWADYEDPSWAPDGRHIVCARTANRRSAIYLLDTLKDSPVALFSTSGNWVSPACSP